MSLPGLFFPSSSYVPWFLDFLFMAHSYLSFFLTALVSLLVLWTSVFIDICLGLIFISKMRVGISQSVADGSICLTPYTQRKTDWMRASSVLASNFSAQLISTESGYPRLSHFLGNRTEGLSTLSKLCPGPWLSQSIFSTLHQYCSQPLQPASAIPGTKVVIFPSNSPSSRTKEIPCSVGITRACWLYCCWPPSGGTLSFNQVFFS